MARYRSRRPLNKSFSFHAGHGSNFSVSPGLARKAPGARRDCYRAVMESRERWVRQLATWFGCGRVPLAPGTAGALGAVPLHYLLKRLHPALHIAAVAIVSAVGIWSSDEMAKLLEAKDPQCVVIDEVAGTLIAMGMVSKRGLGAELFALLLFRAYDIVKPGPVARAEHAQPPGLGIMADDLVAGVLAGITARLLT